MNRGTIKRYLDWKACWSDPEPMDELQYINFNIHPEDILLTGFLFFPNLTEYKEGIFLERNFSDKLKDHPAFNNDTVSELEYEFNKVWIFDLFANSEVTDEETFVSIGKLLKHAWTSHLLATYPEKSFEVELIIDEANYGPILTFCQSGK